jgi:hypothetical protein
MDPVTLAAAAVALLAQKAGGAFGDEAGKAAWNALTGFATFLRNKLHGDRRAGAALDAVEERPADEDGLATLAGVIRTRVENDAQFGSELAAAVQSARNAAIVNHGQFVQIMGSVEKQLSFNAPVHVSGDFNV